MKNNKKESRERKNNNKTIKVNGATIFILEKSNIFDPCDINNIYNNIQTIHFF